MRKIVVLLVCLGFAGTAVHSDPLQNGRPSVALVLGGGAARGFAHIAVLELIEELGIPVDMVVGVSSGAIVGGLFAAGYSPAMITQAMASRDWTSFFQDRPASPFWKANEQLPLAITLGGSAGPIAPQWGKGYSTGQTAYELFKSLTAKIPSYMDFDKLPIPFRAGVVEVPGGKFKLLDHGDLAEAIRASMSIQGVFEPFDIDGPDYVDGGILNNLPIRETREMGYDIVIAVDLFAPPKELGTDLLDLPDLMLILYMNQMSREHHDLADAVLFPLPPDVSTADFSKGQAIYTMARNEREKLAAILEPVREKTAGGIPPLVPDYNDMPDITAQRLIIRGAMRGDRSFIERAFSRHVRNKTLNEENVSAFLESIYETGNYHMVLVRTDLRSGEACLEVVVYPETENKILIRGGLDYEGTFSSKTTNKAALRGGFEFLGKNGYSLLFKASVMDEISTGLMVLKPFGPYFFLSAEANLVREQELIVPGILNVGNSAPDRLLYFNGNLKAGFRLNRFNSLTLWPEYFWFKDNDDNHSMTGFAAAYTFSSLNRGIFPSKGFRLRIENRLRFKPGTPEPFDLPAADLTAQIPLGRKFSLGASGFGSMIFGQTELPARFSAFELDYSRRIYFPHAPGIFTGEKKAALSLSLQFEPVENLSILGGKAIFFLALSSGGSFEQNNWERFFNHSLLWNAAFGAALLPTKTLGLILRTGAGGGGGFSPAPFVSFDVGISRFQKGLF